MGLHPSQLAVIIKSNSTLHDISAKQNASKFTVEWQNIRLAGVINVLGAF